MDHVNTLYHKAQWVNTDVYSVCVFHSDTETRGKEISWGWRQKGENPPPSVSAALICSNSKQKQQQQQPNKWPPYVSKLETSPFLTVAEQTFSQFLYEFTWATQHQHHQQAGERFLRTLVCDLTQTRQRTHTLPRVQAHTYTNTHQLTHTVWSSLAVFFFFSEWAINSD